MFIILKFRYFESSKIQIGPMCVCICILLSFMDVNELVKLILSHLKNIHINGFFFFNLSKKGYYMVASPQSQVVHGT